MWEQMHARFLGFVELRGKKTIEVQSYQAENEAVL